MAGENLVSLKITAEQLAEIRSKMSDLETKVKPLLVALSPQQKKELPKMRDRTQAFVGKVVHYVDTNSEFVPPYMDAVELKTDFEAVTALTEFYNRIEQLAELLNDTIILSGSEAYKSALHYYNTVKQSAKAKVPGAQTIFDDLKVQFNKTTAKATTEPTQ